MDEGYKTTTIQVPFSLHNLARDNFIELKGALAFGIKFLLAEKDLIDYPNSKLLMDLNKQQDKTAKAVQRLEFEAQENDKLKEKLKELGYNLEIEVKEIDNSPNTLAEAEKYVKGLKIDKEGG